MTGVQTCALPIFNYGNAKAAGMNTGVNNLLGIAGLGIKGFTPTGNSGTGNSAFGNVANGIGNVSSGINNLLKAA